MGEGEWGGEKGKKGCVELNADISQSLVPLVPSYYIHG